MDQEQEYEYTYVIGNTPVFMWTAYNSGSYDEATGVVLTYTIPNGFKYDGADCGGIGTLSYAYNNQTQTGTLTWNVGYMPKDGIVTTYVTLMVEAVGDQTANLTTTANLTHVDQYNINPNNNQNITCAITSPPSADIQVNQTETTYTSNGNTYVTYTIPVTNNGPSNATNVQINDNLPNGTKYISDTSGGTYNPTTGIWNIGTLNNQQTTTLTITAQITGTGTIINTAEETNQDQSDNNFNNNAQTTYITITGTYNKKVDISVYNTPWYYMDQEQEYEYTYVIGNTPVFMWTAYNSGSYDEATGVVLTYTIPNGFKYDGADCGGIGTLSYAYNNQTKPEH